MALSAPARAATPPSPPTGEEWAERGWRTVSVTQPDGSIEYEYVLLTPEEFLHPEEGYTLPGSTFHAAAAEDAKGVLARRYSGDDTTGVFGDLIVEWDDPDLKSNCPDVFVAFGIANKDANRTRFVVASEGARPALIIEIVSRRYRHEDRYTKVELYERAGVTEYVILDRFERRGQYVDEAVGYRLADGRYRPIVPDEQGRLLCQTVGLWISLRDGKVVMEDAQTGERLLNNRELEAARRAAEAKAREADTARQAAEAKAREADTARQAAEAKAAELEARLRALEEEAKRRGGSPG